MLTENNESYVTAGKMINMKLILRGVEEARKNPREKIRALHDLKFPKNSSGRHA